MFYMITGIMFVFGAILALIDWRSIAEKWIADKPEKGRVYIYSGEHVDARPGKMIYVSSLGSLYEYKWAKLKLIVAVPGDYPFNFLRGRRMIKVIAGHAVSSQEFYEILLKSKPKNLADAEKEVFEKAGAERIDLADNGNTQGAYDLNALVKGHMGVEIVNSLFGKKVSMWMILIIFVGLALVGYFVYTNFLAEPVPETPTEQPAPGNIEDYLKEEGGLQ